MDSDLNFFIFRQDRQTVPIRQLVRELEASVRAARSREKLLESLLRAGELECALDDAGLDHHVWSITDSIASCLLANDCIPDMVMLRDLPLGLSGHVRTSKPEGFAYYALHPLAYADTIANLELHQAVVIGIRTIGSTLSAIVAAEVRRRGVRASRFTVRPHGNPYARQTTFHLDQRAVVYEGLLAGAAFLIVDEGPGLSGSSFLSVAESLLIEGVRPEQIVLMPGHAPDVTALRAENAASRWQRFRCVPANGPGRRPADALKWIGAGEWRRKFCATTERWPSAWTAMERPKYLSGDGSLLWKFEGFGRYALEPLARARALSTAGFSPPAVRAEEGYAAYPIVRGRALRRGQATRKLLRHLAEYCAFRSETFACEVQPELSEDLASMLRVNWEREFGAGLHPEHWELPVVRPAIADGRMTPHKWIETPDGGLLKVDAVSHGDDHFFPGPCDIAWDLAGTVVEWGLGANAQEYLLDAYQTISGDDPRQRMPNYLRAYAVFRVAWLRMAAAAMRGTREEPRLRRDYERYRRRAGGLKGESAKSAGRLIA